MSSLKQTPIGVSMITRSSSCGSRARSGTPPTCPKGDPPKSTCFSILSPGPRLVRDLFSRCQGARWPPIAAPPPSRSTIVLSASAWDLLKKEAQGSVICPRLVPPVIRFQDQGLRFNFLNGVKYSVYLAPDLRSLGQPHRGRPPSGFARSWQGIFVLLP
jgi:hypothetical protein